MAEATHYVAGVCNINPKEIAQRRKIGNIGLAVVVVYIVLAVALDVHWSLRLAVFLPAVLMASGYIQARNKFCVGYAGAGQQHADDGEVVTITDTEQLAADKKRARKMNLQTLSIAAVIAIVFAALPL